MTYQLDADGQSLSGTVPAASLTVTSDGWVIDGGFLQTVAADAGIATPNFQWSYDSI